MYTAHVYVPREPIPTGMITTAALSETRSEPPPASYIGLISTQYLHMYLAQRAVDEFQYWILNNAPCLNIHTNPSKE